MSWLLAVWWMIIVGIFRGKRKPPPDLPLATLDFREHNARHTK